MLKPLILAYLIGCGLLIVALGLFMYSTTLALWEDPELAHSTIDPSDWPPDVQAKHQIIIYPYREHTWIVALVAVASFFISPTLALKIAQSHKSS